jgi:hypothetical protein
MVHVPSYRQRPGAVASIQTLPGENRDGVRRREPPAFPSRICDAQANVPRGVTIPPQYLTLSGSILLVCIIVRPPESGCVSGTFVEEAIARCATDGHSRGDACGPATRSPFDAFRANGAATTRHNRPRSRKIMTWLPRDLQRN